MGDEDEGGCGGGGGGGVRRAVEGLVYKWVNYGKGWRDRWMVLRDGVLSYYKLRGPAKIAVGGGGGDGFAGRVVIGEESRKYLRKRGFGSGRNFGQCKPFGEVHLKVGLILEEWRWSFVKLCFFFKFCSCFGDLLLHSLFRHRCFNVGSGRNMYEEMHMEHVMWLALSCYRLDSATFS